MANTKKPQTHRKLFENIKTLIYEARNAIVRNVNTVMVKTYFEIGRMIVKDEQHGKIRAGYAEEALKRLSLDLTKEFGKGFSERNLRAFRQFYLTYSTRTIWQSSIAKSKKNVSQASNGDNQEAKKEIKAFNSEDVFTTPKPERLIQRILTLATNSGNWVLDSFLGFGTTDAVTHYYLAPSLLI
jgi:hypothetical protein